MPEVFPLYAMEVAIIPQGERFIAPVWTGDILVSHEVKAQIAYQILDMIVRDQLRVELISSSEYGPLGSDLPRSQHWHCRFDDMSSVLMEARGPAGGGLAFGEAIEEMARYLHQSLIFLDECPPELNSRYLQWKSWCRLPRPEQAHGFSL
jgi:hypothetical protein